MTADDIKSYLAGMDGLFIPEFTWRDKRIDAIIIDIKHRWIRGFEIKTSRSDFLKDQKYWQYSEFCSSISFVCTAGLIQPEEVEKPIGLLWIEENIDLQRQSFFESPTPFQWKKRPGNFQRQKSLSWFWTYLRVLEMELPRIYFELSRFKK